MTAYADLESCDYFDHGGDDPRFACEWSRSLRAVGWLGANADFSTGILSDEVWNSLRHLVRTAWQPFYFLGSHYCGLCVRASGGYVQDFRATDLGKDPSRSGTFNAFIPGDGCVYVAPELILHYITEHHYQPPAVFCDAVLACPPMKGAEYFKALRRNATGGFAKIIPSAPWWRFWRRSPLANANLERDGPEQFG